jgi:hypothetical protein
MSLPQSDCSLTSDLMRLSDFPRSLQNSGKFGVCGPTDKRVQDKFVGPWRYNPPRVIDFPQRKSVVEAGKLRKDLRWAPMIFDQGEKDIYKYASSVPFLIVMKSSLNLIKLNYRTSKHKQLQTAATLT